MSRHKPRSDTKPNALNSPCYLPNTKHEPVHLIGSLHVRGSTLCYVPQYYYSQPKTYVPIPAPTFFPSCWEKLFSCKTFPSSNSNTHKSSSWSQDGFGSRQARTRTSFRLRQQLAPWSSASGSKVLFRFSYQIQFKNQLLKFSLSSKTRLISLYDDMQTNFPPAFLSGSNLGAAAKRISSLICYHAKPLVKLFIKVTYV